MSCAACEPFLEVQKLLLNVSFNVALELTQHACPQGASLSGILHAALKVSVRAADVWAAAATCLCRLIVTHMWFDCRSDDASECSAEKSAQACGELQWSHVGRPFTILVFEDPYEDVEGRAKDMLNCIVERLRSVERLAE
jgi:hypothetical protein